MATSAASTSKRDYSYGKRMIRGFLDMAIGALSASGSSTARLDAELLLVNRLGLPREWLLAHDDAEIAPTNWRELCADLALRCRHCPMAYITGHKAFYGRDFIVTPDVLIPRPESEQIIAMLDSILRAQSEPTAAPIRLLDVGTGSGCLAITAQLEYPTLAVTAVDISPAALSIAQRNAERLGANIEFRQSDLLTALNGKQYDIIIANLPYVDKMWKDTSPELAFEPSTALYASDGGLSLIYHLLEEAPQHLCADGYLVLELDPRQSGAVAGRGAQLGYTMINRQPFTITLKHASR